MCLSELAVAELKELTLGEYVKREAMDVFRKGKNLFFVSSTSLATRSVIHLLSLSCFYPNLIWLLLKI